MNLEIIKQIENNRIDLFSIWEKTGQVKPVSFPYFNGYVSENSSSGFNRVFYITPQHNSLVETVTQIKKYYSEKGNSFLVHTGPTTTPSDINFALLENNIIRISTEIGMALQLDKFDEKNQLTHKLTISEVTNNQMIKDYCNIFGKSFGASDAEIEAHYEMENKLTQYKSLPRKHFLCYINEIPVCCGTLYNGKNAAGIYCLGTLEEFRGNGIGKQMMLYLLKLAKRNYKLAVLHASSAGISIYKKLGFEEYCTLDRYLYRADSNV
ncbi:MAG: GNAT family N-acetyltransferase [Rhodothermaceae bacterium]